MKRPIFISMSFCLLATVFAHTTIQARIYSETGKDGTINYYNSAEPEEKKISPARLQSRFDDIIERYSAEEGIDPLLVKCIIRIESDFNPDAVSVAGAMGLMQLMQSTARIYGVKNPLDPEENLRAGIRHFRSLMDCFGNDISLALAAYHAGASRVKRGMKVPPIASTIKYVNEIMLIYRGGGDSTESVKKLYKKLDAEGDILIYSK
jgi:soluble lytic murein transglycosylase-like protein